MKWQYGNSWEKYPIEEGQVWGLENGSRVAVHNIFNPLPSFMLEADLIFVDPPWNLGNVNSFYTKAGRSDYLNSFGQFETVLFERLAQIAPETVFVEIGNQNNQNWFTRLAAMYPYCQTKPVTYYKKHPTNIIRASLTPAGWDYEGLDEATVISMVAQKENYRVMGDLCMGRGLVGLAAFKAHKPFVGTELNKRRLACLLAEVAKNGGEIKRYV